MDPKDKTGSFSVRSNVIPSQTDSSIVASEVYPSLCLSMHISDIVIILHDMFSVLYDWSGSSFFLSAICN